MLCIRVAVFEGTTGKDKLLFEYQTLSKSTMCIQQRDRITNCGQVGPSRVELLSQTRWKALKEETQPGTRQRPSAEVLSASDVALNRVRAC